MNLDFVTTENNDVYDNLKNVEISKCKMNILHQNIRSMRKNYNTFLCTVGDKIDCFDVIVFTKSFIFENERNIL